MAQDVYTQAELDEALKRGVTAVCRGSGNFCVRGSVTVYASGSATVFAYDSATVIASGSAEVFVCDSTTVVAYGSATVYAYDSAEVAAFGSTTVRAFGSTTVRAYGSTTVRASDSATVRAYGSATVSAYGSATVHDHRVPPEVTASDSPPQAHFGVRRITTRASHIDLVEPWKAGEHDPPMQEWLQLPTGDRCPKDASHYWGTINPLGYFPVRRCKSPGCKTRFRPAADLSMLLRITEALLGTPQRLGQGSAD